jgi:hypothetical protein
MSLYKSFDAYDDVMSMRNPPVHGPRFTQERSVRSIAVILSFPFRFRRARRGRGESQSVRRGKGQSRKRRKSARCRGHPDDPLRSPPSPIMSAQPDHHLSLATVAAFSRLSQRNHKQRGGATRCVKAAAQRCCHGEFPAICINPKSSPFPSRRQGHSGATACRQCPPMPASCWGKYSHSPSDALCACAPLTSYLTRCRCIPFPRIARKLLKEYLMAAHRTPS